MIRAFKNIYPLRDPDYHGPTPKYCRICKERLGAAYVVHDDMNLCLDCQEVMERDPDFGKGRIVYEDFAGLDMSSVRTFFGGQYGKLFCGTKQD